MRKSSTVARAAVAVLVGVMLVMTGAVAPALAATSRIVSGHVTLGTAATAAGAGEVKVSAVTFWAGESTTPVETLTDSSGNYSLPITSNGTSVPYRLTFTYLGANGYTGQMYPLNPLGATGYSFTLGAGDRPGTDATLLPLSTLTGHVNLIPGGVSAGAGDVKVTWKKRNLNDSGYSAESAPVYTDASGNFEFTGLESGYYQLRYVYVTTAGYAEKAFTSGPAVQTIGGPVTASSVTLLPLHSISGKVVLGSSETGPAPSAGDVKVTWRYRVQPQNAWTDVTAYPVYTDASGSYHIPDLADGYYELNFEWVGTSGSYRSLFGIMPQILQSFDSAKLASTVNLARLGALSGTVFLGNSTTRAGAGDVKVEVYTGSIGASPIATTSTDANGQYSVSGLLSTATWVVVFTYMGSANFSPVTKNVYLPADTDAVVPDAVLPPGSGIGGVVVDSDDTPIADQTVYLTAIYRSGPHAGEEAVTASETTTTNANGEYAFVDLAPTYLYVVDAGADGSGYAYQAYANKSWYYLPDVIDLGADEWRPGVNLYLLLPGTISGTVSVPSAPASAFENEVIYLEVLVREGDEWFGTGDYYAIESDGSYEIAGLSPDTYRLAVWLGNRSIAVSGELTVNEDSVTTYNTGAIATRLTIPEMYASWGGATGPLGSATSAISTSTAGGGGSVQYFTNGSIYTSAAGGTRVVWKGPLRDAYFAANSFLGSYGWPQGDRICTAGLCSQQFVGGAITETQISPATPPTVPGVPTTGIAVTATIGTYSPAATSYTYRWFRNGSVIPGATTNKYTPVAGDVDQTLQVEVTAKRVGSYPYVALSAASAPVVASPATKIAVLYASSGGSAGPLGTATTGVIAFPDSGGGSLQHYANGSIYSSAGGTWIVMAGPIRERYWAENSIFGVYGWPTSAADCTPACTQSFQGDTITVTPLTVTTSPAISGLIVAGNVLTVSTGLYSPTATSYTYRWFRDGTLIAGATTNKYTTVASDASHVFTAEVTAKAPGKVPTAAMSAATPTITPTAASQIASLYATNGGALGVATTGVIAFPNNGGGSLQHYTNGSIYSSNNGGTWIVMAGLIREQYWAANSIFGTYGWPSSALSCSGATCSQNFFGPTGTLSLGSQQTSAVTAPSITGSALVGGTLTANKGTYTPTATTFAYAWFRNGVKISGATGPTYVPVAADQYKALTVEVTARSASGMPVAALSAATAAIAPSLASQIGELASTNSGALGASTSGIVAFPDNGGGALQHFKNGSVYGSYTGGVWVVWAGPIREQYWAVNSIFGVYKWPSAAQDCSGPYCVQQFIGGQISAAPIQNTTAPTITGTARVGSVLTATNGAYTPTATTFGYSWWRDGVQIAGASAKTYSPVDADQTHTIVVKVTAGAPGKVAVTTASDPSAAIGASFRSAIVELRASNAALGNSTTAVVAFPDGGGGALQHFQNGSIYSSNVGGTWIVWAGPIRTTYWSANSIFGIYGWPSGVGCVTGCTQNFTGSTTSING